MRINCRHLSLSIFNVASRRKPNRNHQNFSPTTFTDAVSECSIVKMTKKENVRSGGAVRSVADNTIVQKV